MNKGERDAVKQFYGKMEEEARRIQEEKEKKEQQKQDRLEAELWWRRNNKIFKDMDTAASITKLSSLELRFGVQEKLRGMIVNEKE